MRRLAEDRERILSTLRERSDIADTSVPLTSLHQPCASHSARTTTRSATPASSSSSRSVSGPPRTNSSSGPSTPNACHPTAAGLTDAPADSQAPPGSGHFAPRVPQSTDDLRPLHTLPTASGSNQDSIEVLTGSGESETITYHELARRLANRDDVMVVGNHRRTPATSRALPSAAGDCVWAYWRDCEYACSGIIIIIIMVIVCGCSVCVCVGVTVNTHARGS